MVAKSAVLHQPRILRAQSQRADIVRILSWDTTTQVASELMRLY